MRLKDVKSKSDLVQLIKEQISIELPNDETSPLNKQRKVLYTEFPKHKDIIILSLLAKYKIRVENHLNDKYWIFVPRGGTIK